MVRPNASGGDDTSVPKRCAFCTVLDAASVREESVGCGSRNQDHFDSVFRAGFGGERQNPEMTLSGSVFNEFLAEIFETQNASKRKRCRLQSRKYGMKVAIV